MASTSSDEADQAFRSARGAVPAVSYRDEHGRTEPLTERIGSRPGVPLQVLVAEDNLVNRKLATTLLRKPGHKVKAADNGRKAVQAMQAAKDRPFDVVLMDLQMPEMSGFEASQAIRQWESGGARVPLIALTAHAMPGDRERCLEAGMDGYLSKPIDVDELIATVERFGGRAARTLASQSSSQASETVVFDERAALGYTGGDRSLLKNVVKLFRSDYPSALRRIDRALLSRDFEALRLAAHARKARSRP
jgi:CheY-like chemotaxis protein